MLRFSQSSPMVLISLPLKIPGMLYWGTTWWKVMDKVPTFALLFFTSCYLFWDAEPTCLGNLIQQTAQHQDHVLCHWCLTHRLLLMPHALQLPWLFTFIIYHECQSQGSASIHEETFPSKIAWELLRENLVCIPLESSLQLLKGWCFASPVDHLGLFCMVSF